MHLLRPLLLIVVATWITPQIAVAQKIHVLIVGDTAEYNEAGTRNPIAASTKLDVENIKAVFEENVPATRLHVEQLSGPDVSAKSIERALRDEFSVGRSDAFVFCFAGHGYYFADRDQNTSGDRHAIVAEASYLDMPFGGRDLSRAAVRAILARQKPRLTVVLTDMCSGLGRPPEAARHPVVRSRGISPLFDELFLQSSGVVDLSATKPPELGWGSASLGGFFTHCLVETLRQHRQQRMTWQELVNTLTPRVASTFRNAFRNQGGRVYNETAKEWQTTQTVYPYLLPGQEGNGPAESFKDAVETVFYARPDAPVADPIKVGIFLGRSLSPASVSRLKRLSTALKKEGATVMGFASHDRNVRAAVNAAFADPAGNRWPMVFSDFRELLDRRELDAVVFVGLLDSETTFLHSPRDAFMPSNEVLDLLVVWCCQANKDVFVARDEREWRPARARNLWSQPGKEWERIRLDHPAVAATKHSRVCWYEGKGNTDYFAGFLRSVKSRSPGIGQIRE